MLVVLALLGQLGDRLSSREDRGGVVVEYGIVVGLIALGLAAVGALFVDAVGAWFADIAASFPL